MVRSGGFALWLAAAVLICSAVGAGSASAALMDPSNRVEHHHLLLFAPSSGRNRQDRDAEGSNTARYVQLSNGSRYVCETVRLERRTPRESEPGELGYQLEALIAELQNSNHPCIYHVQGKYERFYCWGAEIREDISSEKKSRLLGSTQNRTVSHYWSGNDAFGRYAAALYPDGDECPYDKGRRFETEVRYYCRTSKFQNPIPYMNLYESSQCRYVMRLQASRFCSIPLLDHQRVEETVQCQMIDE